MKKRNKPVAMLLVLVMMTGMLAIAPISTSAYTAHSQTEAVNWARSQNGKSLDYDGEYGAQCVDLIMYYYQYLGVSSPGGDARDYRSNSLPSGWQRINYYSGLVPNPGDICVWGPYQGPASSEFGHVGIVISGNSTTFNSVEQNVSGQYVEAISNRSTSSVACFIRPDFTPTIMPTQCISDGDYHIITALDSSLGLNIAYNSTDNCANVQLWDNMEEANMSSLVTVKHIGSGYYTMTFKNSGRNLDIANATSSSGANVWQYDNNGSDAQKWIVTPSGDGFFYIISKLNNNLYLNVSGGSAAPGTNVQVYSGNSSNAQKWKFIASGATTGKTIESGEYIITSALSRYACINLFGGSGEDGTNVHIWNNVGFNVANAVVNVDYLGNGLYSIIFKKTGKSLDIDGIKNTKGTNVQQWTYNGNIAQKWIIKPAGDGYYYIITRCSGLAVEAQGGNSSNGTNVQSYLWNKTNAQKWKFVLNDYHIEYDPNDGNIYNDTVTSCKIDGYNGGRLAEQVVAYTGVYGSKTTTNIYGDEYSFDENGKKVGARYYGTESGLSIPSGGFVISKSATSTFDLYHIAESAEYAYLDTQTDTVYFCNNQHDYNVISKKVAQGKEYGDLSIPQKEGSVFVGWYTAPDGGQRITSESIFGGVTKLYARWTNNEIGDTNLDGKVTIDDATVIQKAAADMVVLSDAQKTVADVDGDGRITVKDATCVQKYLAKYTSGTGSAGQYI